MLQYKALLSTYSLLFMLAFASSQTSNSLKEINLQDIIQITNNDSITAYYAKKSYFEFVYSLQTEKLLNEKKRYQEKITEISQKHYELGDITKAEMFKILAGYETLNAEITSNRLLINSSHSILQKMLNTKDDLFPKNDSLFEYPLFNPVQIEEIHDTLPIKQFLRLNELFNSYQKSRQFLTKYQNYDIPYAKELLNQSRLLYVNEDISYLEFCELIDQVYEIKINYLAILYHCNQKALEIEYFNKFLPE